MAQFVLSAQNFDIYEGDGLDPFARTGDISADMLYNSGAEGVILGHSEVVDSSEIVKKKLLTIVNYQKEYGEKFLSKSTLLVGESWNEFENNSPSKIADLISQKLLSILKDLPINFIKNLVVGYEPKWGSKGSGRDDMPPPIPQLISACANKIKEKLEISYGKEISSQIPIIYGGRSSPERTEQILSDKNIAGLILGSACNTVSKTLDIAKIIQKMRPDKRKILHANFKAYKLTDSYKSYIDALRKLSNEFIIYLSPPYTDIRGVRSLLT